MRKLLAIVFAATVFNIIFFPFQKQFFGSFVIPSIGTIGFTLLIIAFQAFQYISFYDKTDEDKKKNVITLSAISIILAVMSVFRTSMVDVVVFSGLSLVSSVLSLYIFSLPRGESIDSLFEIAISPVALFFESIAGFFKGMKFLRAPKINLMRIHDHGILYLLLGVALGFPVVLLILALLSSADPVFSKFLTNTFNIKDFPWWLVRGGVSRAVLTAIFLVGAIGTAFVYVKKQNQKRVDVFNDNESKRKTSYVALSVVAMVGAVLAAFLIVGFPYLFTNVPETELHKFGVNTLSEYVTKGFTELLVVSVIVYLSSAMAVAIYKLGGKASTILKWFNIFLLSEIVVFILSIFRRVSLYQMTHGLTRVRIYGSVFLAALILLTIVLMLRHNRKIVKWFWYELSVFVIAAFTIFILRPDYLIANKYKPTVNKEIDYVHIVRLSPEAVDGWVEAYEDAKKNVDSIEAKYNEPLTDYAIDERRAYYTFLTLNILRQKYKELTLKYGSAQEIFDARATHGRPKPLPDFKMVNIEEKGAYEELKREIDMKELIAYEEKMYNLLYKTKIPVKRGEEIIYQERSVKTKFDRSLDSPLVPAVKVVR